MLVASRLAGLSALAAHYAGVNRPTQSAMTRQSSCASHCAKRRADDAAPFSAGNAIGCPQLF
jgi:hypothetical protein